MQRVNFPNLDNRTEADLVQAMVAAVVAREPRFTDIGPNSVLYNFIESFVAFSSYYSYIANEAVRTLKQAFMEFMGLEMREASYATCDVTFTLIEALPTEYIIPEGTQLVTRDDPSIYYATAEDAVFEPGETSVTVAAIADEPGTASMIAENDLANPTRPLAYIDTVTNTESVGGEDAETVEDAIVRLQGVISTQYRAVTPDGFEALAEQVPGVYKAKCWKTTDYYSGNMNSPSHTTVIVYPSTGDGTEGLRQAVEDYLDERRNAGWPLHVKLALPITINISVQVVVRTGYTLQQVEDSIRDNLEESMLDHDSREEFTIQKIKNVINSAPGVVKSLLILPEDDTAIGPFQKPKLGTLTVAAWQ